MKLKPMLACCFLTAIPAVSIAQEKVAEINPMNPKLSKLLSYLDTDGQSLTLSDDESFLEDMSIMADKVIMPTVRKQRGMENLSMLSIIKTLGFDQITATGSSSKQHGPIHIKKLFIETKNNNRGVFSLLGAKPAPYVAAGFAPSDTDLIIETQLNLSQVYDTVMRLMEIVSPDALADNRRHFAQKLPGSDVTIKDFLSKMDARISLAAELNIQNREMPFRATMRIDNVAKYIWTVMGNEMKKNLKIKSDGNIHSFDLPPIKGIVPVSVIFNTDTNFIWITTNLEHLAICQSKALKLDTSEAYLAATNGLPKTGSSQLYLSKKAIATWITILDQQMQTDKAGIGMQGVRNAWKEIKKTLTNSEGIACALQKNADGLLTVMNTPFRLRSMNLLYTTPVLASIATPLILKKRKDADRTKAVGHMAQLRLALTSFKNDKGRNPKNLAELSTLPEVTKATLQRLITCHTDEGEMEFAYINGDGKPIDTITVYTPAPIGEKYVVLFNDGSINTVREREFKQLLAASNK